MKDPISSFFFNHFLITPTLILSLTLLLHFAAKRLIKKILPQLEKTHLLWDSAILSALRRPLKVFIWILGSSFALQVLAYHFDQDSLFQLFKAFRTFAFIVIGVWFFMRFVKNMELDYFTAQKKRKKPFDQTTVRAVCQIARIFIILIGTLVFMQSRNVNISAVLAFGGAGGLVVGFAAKDLLANFFGGFMIFLDRPFSVGDWIRSPEKEIEGHVEHIGWRLTRIRTLAKRPLYIPNGIFSNICVENPSRMTNRRIKSTIGIRYKDADKIRAIANEIEEMLKNHHELDPSKRILTRFEEFGPSSLNLLIYCYTKATNFSDYTLCKQEIFLKALEVIHKHGAECAFPTTTLHCEDSLVVKTSKT